VHHQGKPVKAWVYAVAEDIEPQSDFREFQPVLSDEDGKFQMLGLAPGSYLFFASDIELSSMCTTPPRPPIGARAE
jgi:hypothetical protein